MSTFASMPHLPGTGLARREAAPSRTHRTLRLLAHLVFGDYGLYRIYALNLAQAAEPPSTDWAMAPLVDVKEFSQSVDASLRALAAYTGAEAHAFGAWVDGHLAAGCWFWSGETYRRRNFWPLAPGDAKLVQITTAAEFRGRGIGPALISFGASHMKRRGFNRLFARVWHSHAASLAAFRKAGWKEAAFVVEVFPFRSRRPFRVVRRRAPR